MKRNDDRRVVFEPEALLAAPVASRRSWLPVTGVGRAVDPRRWQLRAARGFSWHASGMSNQWGALR